MNVESSPLVFDERFGELPKVLLKSIRRFRVTPAEFYAMEYNGMDYQQMFDHIVEHSRSGSYRVFL